MKLKKLSLVLGSLALCLVSARGALVGQLGVLDVSGTINPVTSSAWSYGDQYRLMFVTSTTVRDAASSNIADYNTDLTTFANNAGLGGDWFVVGSTATVNARVNTATVGTGGVGIFALNGGTKIADNYGDLWNNNIDNAILTEAGNIPSTVYVAVGTFANGNTDTARPLGDLDAGDLNRIQAGQTNQTGTAWARVWNTVATNDQYFYAMSDTLTVIPEPSSTALLGLGGLALMLRRRR